MQDQAQHDVTAKPQAESEDDPLACDDGLQHGLDAALPDRKASCKGGVMAPVSPGTQGVKEGADDWSQRGREGKPNEPAWLDQTELLAHSISVAVIRLVR